MTPLTNNRILTLFTLLLITANIVTLALLWSHKTEKDDRHPAPPPIGEVFTYLSNELKLDSAQRDAYKKLREEHREGQRPLQDSIKKAKDDLFALLQQANVSNSIIEEKGKKIGALEEQQHLNNFRHFQKVRNLCNPDQQKKFDSIIQDVLKRLAPQRPQGPPPGREGERPERDRMPPPPGMENGDNKPPPH